MAGEPRIIAFGANGGEVSGADTATDVDTAPAVTDSEKAAFDAGAIEHELAPAGWKAYAPAFLAALAAVLWTGFFVWSQRAALGTASSAQVSALVGQWSPTVVLIVALWLLAMRHSRREAQRFGDAAALLSRESTNLETRLATVNGELSLAREFIASQSRDLESLGRVAVERLTQNAARLQDLVRENSDRLESIQTVSKSALENMDRLRAQLPVIASSAKDVANNIGNAGRTAHDQLDGLMGGFTRLTELGTACDQQVAGVLHSMDAAALGFNRVCEDLERHASARFQALAERGAEFRTQLETSEVEALSAIRSRAAALAQEIEAARSALETHEEESLISLRARLSALRDESGVVGRALQDGETRAVEAWTTRLEAVEQQRAHLETLVSDLERKAVDSLRERADKLALRTAELQARLASDHQATLAALEGRVERIATHATELQSRLTADEESTLARISSQLTALDGAVAARLGEHERHTDALVYRSEALVGALGEHSQKMAAIAQSSVEVEATLGRSLAVLGDRLTASRTTLAATEGEVERLTDASVRLLELIQASAKHSSGVLPEALSIADDRLTRLGDKVLQVIDDIEASSRRSNDVHASVDGLRETLGTVQAQIEAGQSAISDRNETHYAELGALRTALEEIERNCERVGARTRGELNAAVEELASATGAVLGSLETEGSARVRSLAAQLSEESAQALDKVMRPRAAEAAGALEQAVSHATGAGREAAAQMREQLLAVEEAVGNLENRVALARERAQEQVDGDFSRRAAQITEALKSNAVDIASALSSDVADTAWSAYLRGDRGIFTRRAVSLLEAGEARAIQQLFERDDSFRDHVNRYIHDFEALLRQVLSTREGNTLGVTLLSSDMGKLYVALAQGIERLRS